MERKDCWMTFSEALEEYLSSREAASLVSPGKRQEELLNHMKMAAEHMDALTSGNITE